MAETVARFINSTARHVFLTGKAGTGKTTFLRSLAGKTHKNFIVVAPTGIAALNAGGVTIHSQFLLPFGTFFPGKSIPENLSGGENFYTTDMLARRHPLNSQRKQVLRSIDLLVIDEVSMLRADLLDAIEYRMKAARGNFYQSFGGVQVLFIGDLFQLPPIVARTEEKLMAVHYASPWFFEAQCLKASPPAYIELNKIYRQQDDAFIHLLNNFRNNTVSPDDINTLNALYRTDAEIRAMKEIITLTTHNYKAEELNQQALRDLSTPAHTFEASIEDDFPDSMFPVTKSLVLKVGAQIMFIKNDTIEKKYFNGKLATVVEINGTDVIVALAESHTRYTLKREEWENKKYTLDKEHQVLEEEVIGKFVQFPVKLAWAITVHKSQGLTFERAIVDVGQAFADGQVYVALSRLRSLEGLVLRSRINPGVVSTDKTIVGYAAQHHAPEQLPVMMHQEQHAYLRQVMAKTFDFSSISKEINWFKTKHEAEFLPGVEKPVPAQIDEAMQAERMNTEKFVQQLARYWNENNLTQLQERIEKGVGYYKAHVGGQLKNLLGHIRQTQQRKRVKTYLGHLNELDQMLSKKLEELEKVLFLTKAIVNKTNAFDFSHHQKQLAESRQLLIKEVNAVELAEKQETHRKKRGQLGYTEIENPLGDNEDYPGVSIFDASASPRHKQKKSKAKKNPDERSTYDITLEMLNSGMQPEAIAKERGLVLGTIEGHLAKAVSKGSLDIYSFVAAEVVQEIQSVAAKMPEGFSSKDLFDKLAGKYGYGKLRAVMAHLGKG